PTHCNSKPRRGMIRVASQFIGWYAMARKTRAFRYATTDSYRVPTARIPLTDTLPAIKMAGYPYQMPTALLAKLENNDK
ncbi:MAG: hypothetical protein J5545_01775, partial [Bacteroidaceae bacterium]|nr:hypothetical protein [Bacteroidaceae bacterium]